MWGERDFSTSLSQSRIAFLSSRAFLLVFCRDSALGLIEIIAETGSTNSDMAARLTAGESVGEGRWLVTDRQTAGRGRLGRNWSDGSGNFMGSTSVRIAPGDPPPLECR